VAGDRDSGRVDPSRERPQCEQAVDDEAHVARLVDEVGLVGAAERVRPLERERGRGDDEARPRPGAEQAAVRFRSERVTVREDDQRIRPAGGRIADDRLERPRHAGSVRQADRAGAVDEAEPADADGRPM
jgi:hypothetical protein